MNECEEGVDLVVVIGTSLSGLNADRVVTTPARRSLTGRSLGSVIINLQQTVCDPGATLRIFSESDKLFDKLLTHLNLSVITTGPGQQPPAARALVPYDRHGRRTQSGDQMMWLDLSKGQKIKLNQNHNCQESRQPVYSHIGMLFIMMKLFPDSRIFYVSIQVLIIIDMNTTLRSI